MNYIYKAIDKSGKTIKSFIEAEEEKDVLKIVKNLGLNLISVKPVKRTKKVKAKNREILIFTRLLSRLVRSHISVIQSLSIIQENIENNSFKTIIANMASSIEKGNSLSQALARYAHIFSPFYCGVIKAGENSGQLGNVLELLFKYLQFSDNTRKKFITALFYPVFILITALIILSLIFVFVIPQFNTLYNMFDTPLPALTLFFLKLSCFIKENILILLAGSAGLLVLLKIYFNTSQGKRFTHRIIFKIPVAGKLYKEFIYARFCQILSLLVSSNTSIPDSFDLIEDIMTNSLAKEKMRSIRSQIKEGKSLTDAITETGFFPDTIIQMVKAGEESGELDNLLASAAQFYEENLILKIELLSSMLQPVLIIIIGIFIAVIIISIFLPVFQLGTIIK